MTDFSQAPQFDTGPLSWVIGEIREALGRSRAALDEAAERGGDARETSLKHAKTHLHQAHGAVQMVDADGVGLLTNLAEQALERFRDGTLDCTAPHAGVVAEAYLAVTEYLDELLSGAAPQPARLFPYYRALGEMLGADRIHPADLLFVDLSQAAVLPPAPAPAESHDYTACRARFEKSLLPYLKSTDPEARRANALAMQEAIAAIAGAQQEPAARTFWLAMQSFAELVASGALAGDLYVKQLFGLINLQIRRLSQGQGSLPEAMLRDALFFIAVAPSPTPAAQALRRAYRLDGMVPSDYDVRRYGRIDAQALKAAKDALAQAQAGWDRLAQDGDAGPEAGFESALAALAEASDKLGTPALAQLVRELGRAAGDSVMSGRGDQFGIEMAAALLFVEHGLDQIRRLPLDFEAHAEVIGTRLLALAAGETPPVAPQWQGDLSRRIQQGQTVAVLAAEMKHGLRQVEKVLDDYYVDPARRATLVQIDPLLHQLQGALAILDQEHAMRAALHVKEAVRELAGAEGNPELEAASLNNIAQNIGALGFFIDMLAQNVEAARQRFAFEPASGTFRALPFEKAAAADTPFDQEPQAEAPAAAPVAEPSAPVTPAAPVAEGDAAIEAELLEIFIGEAQEVLALVCATLPRVRANPSDQEALTIVRRSFHTLKGSGRMVGLTRFAEPAAAVERMMNVWLSESRSATPDLLALLDHAGAELSAWVEELAATGTSARDGEALAAAAARVQDGGAFDVAPASAIGEPDGEAAVETPRTGEPTAEEPVAGEPITGEPITGETITGETITGEMIAGEQVTGESVAAAPAPAASGNVFEFPSSARPAGPADDNSKRIGALNVPLPLYNIYLHETDELMRLLERDFGEWRHEPMRAVAPEALKAAHTLAGTSATVGFTALRDVAHALEMALMALDSPLPVLDDVQRDLLDTTLGCARQMLREFALGELAGSQPELVAQLQALREQLDAPHAGATDPEPEWGEQPDHMFAGTRDSFGDTPPALDEAGAALPFEPGYDHEEVVGAAIDDGGEPFDPAFDDVFDAPALTQFALPDASGEAALEDDEDDAPELAPELISELTPEPDAGLAAESLLSEPVLSERLLAEPLLADIAPAEVADLPISDDLDPDLLPVFLEEATDLLPEIGNGLRKWQGNPADAGPAQVLLRALHTVKGSARMAGAMRLGQHAHEIETQIENMVHAGTSTPAAFDEVLANYDHALMLFEQLQQSAAGGVQAGHAGQAAAGQPAEEPLAPAQARTPLVRVRADILDRLVNQAGEVSITRSKLENQVGSLKSSLTDFADHLARLRRQLREVEVQAESQIASRMSIAGEREFDPLEFDRFTRLQELTRMMAESVSDVASFHESLTRTVEAAGADLNTQSRLTRDLQRDLMRVRMVPFASLSERLFRVARQTAKEVDKRVNLDIRGGSVEIDRSVLEQMAAPFEHLLRNAIVHGIEPRERRGAAGKADIGELLIQVSQQGNEVVLQFSDDGAGLDLDRIRAKARSRGLPAAGATLSDAEAAELIFEPGFSTADALTELAGRGVGMDVVRSEAEALGGRVALLSTAGKGARFTIHLPLTLAVTQVVITSSKGSTFALPSILVEQVLHMKEHALAGAHAAGAVQFQGKPVALQYLPKLLGDLEARPMSQRSSPVLILKNGADRLAVHVDEVHGNREVVIKNIGPQLARMAGISGATVLGSGEIVLILNPVALSHHLDHHPEARPTAAPGASGEPRARDQVVMVVDDSLTVRRVTQRMLEREGYQVVLAKDGVDALERLQEGTPDLMLVDIEMPRMDGFDLTRNIRGNDQTRAIPIIVITSRTADKHRNYATDLGVNAYFGKPFQEPELLAAIAGLLKKEVPA